VIWATDGTPSGTVDLGSSARVLSPQDSIVTMAGQAYAFGNGALFAIDPVPNGVRSIARIANGSGSTPRPFGGSIYTISNAVVKYSTSATGASVLGQIYPAERLAAAADTTLYFVIREFPRPVELWKTDGTAAGTGLATNFGLTSSGSSIETLTPLGRRLIVALHEGTSTPAKPWVTDGTTAGSKLLRDITLPTSSGEPPVFFVADGKIGRA